MTAVGEKIVKKPAHVVIVEMIEETVVAIDRSQSADGIGSTTRIGMLAAEIEMLKRMIIPEKHLGEVIASLRQIKASCLSSDVEQLLPEAIFLDINQPPQDPITKFLIQGGDFLSKEGMRLINDSKASDIGEAARDPMVAELLVAFMDRSSDPYVRRNILNGLSVYNSVGMS